MKLYLVRGYWEIPSTGEEFVYLYGVFSSEEMASKIKNDLEAAEGIINETYKVEEITLDEPTDVYYFMINN